MMEELRPYESLAMMVFISTASALILYFNFPSFADSNFISGLITFIVGNYVVYLYIKQKEDNKRDAAKIILQEIRRAEEIIGEYKEYKQYKFTKKIIATNSWSRNIHFFVGDLNQDELDKISNLYSMGKYLDEIISKISDFNFEESIKIFEENIKKMITVASPVTVKEEGGILQQNNEFSGGNVKSGSQVKELKIPVNIPAPWQGLLNEVSLKYEPIYHTTIVGKLKKIAKAK